MRLGLGKRTWKRLAGVVVGAASFVVLAGCGSPTGDSASAPKTAAGETPLKIGIVFDRGGRGDKSFNDSAWRGVERARAELGIQDFPIESKSDADYETNLAALADQGMDLVIAVGINMRNALERVAPQYPNVRFAIVDAPVDMPNVRSLLFAEEEGSFLAGYAAALASRTGRVGFVGGMQIPLIEKFFAGFAAGARTANPNIVVLPEKYTGSWDNIDVGKVSANVLFNSNADVVYHAAGRAGIGVINAAKEQRRLAIGVDSNQDDLEPGFVLTSMIKRVDEAVFQTIKDLKEGNFTAGAKMYNLAAGGVGLTDFVHTKDRIGGEEGLARIQAIAERIKSGEISVPTNKRELETFSAGTGN